MFECFALSAPRLNVEGDVIQFGAEIDASEIEYFLLERMATSGEHANRQYTSYVEFGDQSISAYDGLERVDLAGDRASLILHLRFEVPDVGSVVKIVSPTPLDAECTAWLVALNDEIARTKV